MRRRRLLLALLALPGTSGASEPRAVAITLEAGAASGPDLVPGPQAPVLRVSQGERLALTWTTDADAVLHLHGYDIEFGLTALAPTTLALDAHAAGRFPVATHGAWAGLADHTTILFLEVHPQ